MKRGYLVISISIILLTVGLTAAAILIERGEAYQSQTDSNDEIWTPQHVIASTTEGKMVSINPIVYEQSEDKESYQLTDVNQSVQGMLDIKTKDDRTMGLKAMVTFQEPGTWLFIETMDIVTQRQVGFIILVDVSTTLSATTILTIDDDGDIHKTEGSIVPGHWKVWGVGTPTEVSYVTDPSDAYKGFIVLVDSTYTLTNFYNVIKISGSDVELDTSADSIGDRIDLDGKSWKVWNEGVEQTTYAIKGEDIRTRYENQSITHIYDFTNPVSGKPTSPIPVITGEYSFWINIKYKAQINIDPTDYQGNNMNSNVVFILSDPRIIFDANGGEGIMAEQSVPYGVPTALNPSSFDPPASKTFSCWNTAKDGSGVSYIPGTNPITATNDVTLYAIWINE